MGAVSHSAFSSFLLLHQFHKTHQAHNSGIGFWGNLNPRVGEPFLVFIGKALVQGFERLELLFGFLLFLCSLVVNDLVIDLLTDGFRQFVNRPFQNTLILKAFPGAVVVGRLRVRQGVIPPRVVGGVAEAVAGVGGMATESDFLAVDGGT